jgi:integrase
MDTESGRKPITPHVLKHTAITWALQKGATIWDAAGYFDTSTATIEKVYGHHSPDHQSSAVEAVNRRG